MEIQNSKGVGTNVISFLLAISTNLRLAGPPLPATLFVSMISEFGLHRLQILIYTKTKSQEYRLGTAVVALNSCPQSP